MKFVFALIALFAASAMAQTFAVTNIYSNDNCTALVGQYVNTVTTGCTADVTTCTQFGAGSGHFYLQNCSATAVPAFSPSWVVASLWDDGCANAGAWLAGMPDTCFIFTPNPQAPTSSFLAADLGSCSSNTSSIVNVAPTDGASAVSSTTCTTSAVVSNFNNTYTCTSSGIAGYNFALTQCQEEAAPVAEPTAEPTTATPTAPTTPTTPTHPTAAPKASSAAALAASGLLSVVALLL